MLAVLSTTLTSNSFNPIGASLAVTAGLEKGQIAVTTNTLTAILQFVAIVGIISFVRGIFVIRGAAEGNQQSSVMAGVTHIIAGGVAVNLKPFLIMLQSTLGVTVIA